MRKPSVLLATLLVSFTALWAGCEVETTDDLHAGDDEGLETGTTGEEPSDESESGSEMRMAPMGGGWQDCFYGVGPGGNCFRCICVDAETREFEYYCSECIAPL